MPIDFEYIDAVSTDALVDNTIRNEVISATFTKNLKDPAFASFAEIENLECFLENFSPEARADYANDGGELERPLQASWHLQDGAMQRALRAALTHFPAYIEGSESDFSAFIPMGQITNFKDGSVYIPGYLIIVAQEGPEACIWTHTPRARVRDVVYDDVN
jgi:hypothetical protein